MVTEAEMLDTLEACRSCRVGGHHGGAQTTHKLLLCGYYLLKIHKYAVDIVWTCCVFQSQGSISRQLEFPMRPILDVEFFDVWCIDCMGPFVSSDKKKYILVAV